MEPKPAAANNSSDVGPSEMQFGQPIPATPAGSGAPRKSVGGRLRGLVKDRRLLAVAAIGAALGAGGLIRKRAAEGGPVNRNAGGSTLSTYTPGGIGSYDSTATDAYNNIQAGLENGLQGVQDQITKIEDQLQNMKPEPKTAPSMLSPGYGWFATDKKTYSADAIASTYGISLDALSKMNPALKITSGSSIITRNTPVKVRSNAARWNLAAYRRVNPGKKR